MSNLPEITGLFAKLASEIETLNPKFEYNVQSDDALVAAYNQSLNLSEQSRVRVLDTALSLMCFTASQVFDSIIDYSVKTLVSVLSSSIECKVLRSGEDNVLRIGGSISAHDCVGVMESCADVLEQLVKHGKLSCSLLSAVLRVAVMATQFRYTLQLLPVLEVQSTEGRSLALSKLVYYIPKGISNQELQLRLLSWYLSPQTLMEDVSQVLQDAVKRPFLYLNGELYEKMEWRSIIICLALSPLMFIETRALLHSWFLATGLASVLELQVELASMVLDVVSRPMWWGLSAEIGSKVPFSHAYFLFKHLLFETLAGPLSCGGFLELVRKLKKSDSQTKRSARSRTSMVDHKSAWAMAMNFPDWFHFASLLLFFEKSFRDSDLPSTSSFSDAAAWYIAWILNPLSESYDNLLAEKMKILSSSLIDKYSSSDKHKKSTSGYKSKLKKPKITDKDDNISQEFTCQKIRLWLEEFKDIREHNPLFRRIILGILIGCPGFINEFGCELLLHYAANGLILKSTESQHSESKYRRWNNELEADYIDSCSKREAIAGARTGFHTTDVAERMSFSIFETPELGVDFICKVKLRVVKYVLKCVKRLLQFEIDQDDVVDLQKRILRWRHQGKDVFHGYKDLDDAINVITCKLASSSPRGNFRLPLSHEKKLSL